MVSVFSMKYEASLPAGSSKEREGMRLRGEKGVK